MADPVEIGGAYVESESHVPNPTDIVAQYNTSGTGAHQKIEEISPIFEVDKVKTAEQILGALDPKDTSVSADKVLLPNVEQDNDAAAKAIKATAKARVQEGVVVGGPTPAEREAEDTTGTDGEKAAKAQEAENAAQNSVGTNAGEHDAPKTGDDDKSATTAKTAAAKKTAASSSTTK